MILDYGGDIPTPDRKPGMLWGSGSIYYALSISHIRYIAQYITYSVYYTSGGMFVYMGIPGVLCYMYSIGGE